MREDTFAVSHFCGLGGRVAPVFQINVEALGDFRPSHLFPCPRRALGLPVARRGREWNRIGLSLAQKILVAAHRGDKAAHCLFAAGAPCNKVGIHPSNLVGLQEIEMFLQFQCVKVPPVLVLEILVDLADLSR